MQCMQVKSDKTQGEPITGMREAWGQQALWKSPLKSSDITGREWEKMCYGSESVKLGYDSSITPGQRDKRTMRRRKKRKRNAARDRCLQETKPEYEERCVTYQKGIMATVAMDMVTNDNYCYSQRNQYINPLWRKKKKTQNKNTRKRKVCAQKWADEPEEKPALKQENMILMA